MTDRQPEAAGETLPLVEIRDLKKHYPISKGMFSQGGDRVFAVDGVSFRIAVGETLGLVGESGCGKTTLGRTILKLVEPTAGEILFRGENITRLSVQAMRPYRCHMQIVFQDPYSSLNPRLTAGQIVAEPLIVHGRQKGKDLDDKVCALFERVGLAPAQRHDHPRSFSGGQRQRIGIARALALRPSFIVGDEPVSALDVSVQAQVINLLMDLQDELNLSYLFIAHDLAVVSHISHRIGVMYLGRIVELAPAGEVVGHPLHPYSIALLSAVPAPDPWQPSVRSPDVVGEVPSPTRPPSGCHFHTRCPFVGQRCRTEPPRLREVATGHWVSCHLHDAATASGGIPAANGPAPGA
jgi:peptide/nickel transport system ATP-binding protein/oligopeptide transport system ATP-binding protein